MATITQGSRAMVRHHQCDAWKQRAGLWREEATRKVIESLGAASNAMRRGKVIEKCRMLETEAEQVLEKEARQCGDKLLQEMEEVTWKHGGTCMIKIFDIIRTAMGKKARKEGNWFDNKDPGELQNV